MLLSTKEHVKEAWQSDSIMITEIIGQDFDREVLQCKLPVFTCLTTRWCHSCYPACLFADQLAKEYDGKVKFVRVDIEESPEIAKRYNVIVVPTIVLFQNSQPMKRLLGFQDLRSLRSLLDNVTTENEPTGAAQANESNRLSSRRLETNEAQE